MFLNHIDGKCRLNLSDGNLNVQIRKLEEEGHVEVEKVFVDRKEWPFLYLCFFLFKCKSS